MCIKEMSQGKDKNKDTEFEVGHIMKLLRDKCSYTIIKYNKKYLVKFTVDNPIVVDINPMHAFIIYNNMIFMLIIKL